MKMWLMCVEKKSSKIPKVWIGRFELLVERDKPPVAEESHSALALVVEVEETRDNPAMAVAVLVRQHVLADGCWHKLGYDLRKLPLPVRFHLLHPQEGGFFPYARWAPELLVPLDCKP